MNSSQLCKTLGNTVAQFSQPRHPLARIDYELTVVVVDYDRDTQDPKPHVRQTRRSSVVEVVPSDYTPKLPSLKFNDVWEKLGRCRKSDGTGYNGGNIRPSVLHDILEHSVVPDLFLAQFYDKDHDNGINVHVRCTKSHSHAIRFFERFNNSVCYLDIFRIEKIA
jgi:hypothetical protein